MAKKIMDEEELKDLVNEAGEASFKLPSGKVKKLKKENLFLLQELVNAGHFFVNI